MSSLRPHHLRCALATNAVFSAACGVTLLVESAQIAPALGRIAAWHAIGTGAMLAIFAALVGLTAVRLRIGWALIVSMLDLAWIAVTLPLIFVPGLLSSTGVGAVVAVAAIVGCFAGAQLAVIRSMLREREGEPERYRHCIRVKTDAPAQAMWSVVADLGAIARYSPALAYSRIRDGASAGVGAVRECANLEGAAWSEEVALYEPAGQRLVLRFQTEAPDFPFPVSSMSGGWQVAEDGEGSVVDVWWSLTPNSSFGWILVALMTIPLDRDMHGVIGRMAEAAQGRPYETPPAGLTLAYC